MKQIFKTDMVEEYTDEELNNSKLYLDKISKQEYKEKLEELRKIHPSANCLECPHY